MAILFTRRVMARKQLKRSCCRNVFHISFCSICPNWDLKCSFNSNKPTYMHTYLALQTRLRPSFSYIYSLTSTPNDRFLRNLFMAGLFTLRVFTRYPLRGNRLRNIFSYFVLMTDLGYKPIDYFHLHIACRVVEEIFFRISFCSLCPT